MKIIQNIGVFAICFLIFGCRKDKLDGEKEILVGIWQWSYSEEIHETCNPPTYTTIHTPVLDETNYSIEFQSKGKLFLFKDAVFQEEYRIEIDFGEDLSSNPNYSYAFTVYLDGVYENKLSGAVGDDSLLINRDFPFPDTNCENFANYFVRTE